MNWIPLISGLLGAIIGAGTSILTVYIQSRASANRDRQRHITELALKDYEITLKHAKDTGTKGAMPPISRYIYYYSKLNTLMEQDHITGESLSRLHQETMELAMESQKEN